MENKKGKGIVKIKLWLVILIVLVLTLIFLLINNQIVEKNKKQAKLQEQLNLFGSDIYLTEENLDFSKIFSQTPNHPILGAGMIPIKYNLNEQKFEITNQDNWYDYSNQTVAFMMLSDGYYKSEPQYGIDEKKQLASNNIGGTIDNEKLGTIFFWIPRLCYSDTNVEFLKDTSIIEYIYTTEECFNFKGFKPEEIDLGFTGLWVGITEFDNLNQLEQKNEEFEQEENTQGLIKNELISCSKTSEITAIQKLNEKCNIESDIIKNISTMQNRQIIKVLNVNNRIPLMVTHTINNSTATFNTIYSKYGMRCAIHEDGKVLTEGTNNNEIKLNYQEYLFFVIDNNGNIRRQTLNIPYLKGYNKDVTFYVSYDSNGNEQSYIPIGEDAPNGWYDYENQTWANIVVRENGYENYFTWIPRYVYKLDQENEKVDAKIVDLDNVYIDINTGKIINYNNTEYILPEAFEWEVDNGNTVQLTGFWMSKYELTDESNTRLMATVASYETKVRVSNIIPTNTIASTYKAYLIKDGKILEEKTLTDGYTFNLPSIGKYVVSIVQIDESGNTIAGYAKEFETYELDPPDVLGFRVDTTYIVTYDTSGNESYSQKLEDVLEDTAKIREDNTLEEGKIDLSKINGVWYDYTKQIWANIVTINNGKTIYLTWIPRYEYIANSGQERVNAIFIPKTKVKEDTGYTIPEAFEWEDKDGNTIPISGYWMSKYELTE